MGQSTKCPLKGGWFDWGYCIGTTCAWWCFDMQDEKYGDCAVRVIAKSKIKKEEQNDGVQAV